LETVSDPRLIREAERLSRYVKDAVEGRTGDESKQVIEAPERDNQDEEMGDGGATPFETEFRAAMDDGEGELFEKTRSEVDEEVVVEEEGQDDGSDIPVDLITQAWDSETIKRDHGEGARRTDVKNQVGLATQLTRNIYSIPGMVQDYSRVDRVTGESWDFNVVDHAERAQRSLDEAEAVLTIFGERTVANPEWSISDQVDAMNRHADYAAKLSLQQAAKGMFFVVKVQRSAPIWGRRPFKQLVALDGASLVNVLDTEKGEITYVTNAPAIAWQLRKGEHRERGAGKAQSQAKIRRRVMSGLVKQMKCEGRVAENQVGTSTPVDEVSVEQLVDECLDVMASSQLEYWDDISGKRLEGELVTKARIEELAEFVKHKVYTKVPLARCYELTGRKPIGVRWVDVNKGDEVHPEYRSRLVAKEIKTHKRDDLFAATPPVEAKKMLFSLAVTEGFGFEKGKRAQGMKLDFIDVRRAYFHAPTRRKVFVELPPEDDQPGMCGELNQSMYGTRDAAQNWEQAYSEFMASTGFVAGKASPCLFEHPERNLRAVIYGDDFTILGLESELDWFKSQITKRFEVKHRGRLGPQLKDDKSIRILNRIVEWTDEGIIYEADQRHADIIIDQLGLKATDKSLVTPSVKSADRVEGEDDEIELIPVEATLYRAMTARGMYMAQDRSDVQYAVKELS